MADSAAALQVLAHIESGLWEFEAHMPLIHALRTTGLRERHWAQLYERTGIRFEPSLDLTLVSLHERYDFDGYLPTVRQIAQLAAREAEVEALLERMVAELERRSLSTSTDPSTGVPIVTSLGEIDELLRAQLRSLHGLSTANLEPFAERLDVARASSPSRRLELWAPRSGGLPCIPSAPRRIPPEPRRRVAQVWRGGQVLGQAARRDTAPREAARRARQAALG